MVMPVLAWAEVSGADANIELKKALEKALPQYRLDEISASPVDGLFEVRFGTQVVYVSGDGRYLLQGKLIDLQTKQNLTEPKVAGARVKIIAEQSEDEMIIYPAAKTEHTVTVFTDIDCPYCRKFHREMADYNKLGISVRYMLFPRAGVGSESYKKAVSVWCAEDRNTAMDRAKGGDFVESRDCDNPVKAQMALGDQLGVRGTPTIFLADGTILPGYVDAKELRKVIDQ